MNTLFIAIYTATGLSVLAVLSLYAFALGARRSPKAKTASVVASAIVVVNAIITIALVSAGSPSIEIGLPITMLAGGALLVVNLAAIFLTPSGRELLTAIPLHWLIIPEVARNTGAAFLFLLHLNLVPEYWALTAGWGDIFVGVTALPVAWYVMHQKSGWRAIALVWVAIGIIDFIHAGWAGSSDQPRSVIAAAVVGFGVPNATLLHIMLIARLLRR